MEVLRDQARPERPWERETCCPSPPEGTVVTIGAYDGVHLGHRSVIRLVRRRAAERGLRSAVVTFDRHPASVVRPESAPRLLTDLEQKLELLAATGLDRALVITFDEMRSREPADDFGHQRKGNVELLRTMGADLGFEVEGLPLVDAGGSPAGQGARVSSTAIRH